MSTQWFKKTKENQREEGHPGFTLKGEKRAKVVTCFVVFANIKENCR